MARCLSALSAYIYDNKRINGLFGISSSINGFSRVALGLNALEMVAGPGVGAAAVYGLQDLIEPQHPLPGILCRGLVVQRSCIIKEGMRGVRITVEVSLREDEIQALNSASTGK